MGVISCLGGGLRSLSAFLVSVSIYCYSVTATAAAEAAACVKLVRMVQS